MLVFLRYPNRMRKPNMNETKKISIKDIAKMSGTSIATVSRVLNNKVGGYSDETAKRIRAIAKEYGYVSNSVAKSLRESRSHSIGLILPNVTNHFYATLAQYIQSTLDQNGYSVFLCSSLNNPASEVNYFHDLASKGVDGIICISCLSKITQEVMLQHIPLVFLDHSPESDLKVPAIKNNDVLSGELATTHLLQKGCRLILFLRAYTGHYDPKDRLAGHRKALESNGIEFDERYVLKQKEHSDGHEAARQLIDAFIRTGLPFDGVVCASDELAYGAICSLKEAGIKVPEEVRVIGVNNSSYSQLPSPSISTIERHPDELAQSACSALLKLIEGVEVEEDRIYIPIELVPRQTTE